MIIFTNKKQNFKQIQEEQEIIIKNKLIEEYKNDQNREPYTTTFVFKDFKSSLIKNLYITKNKITTITPIQLFELPISRERDLLEQIQKNESLNNIEKINLKKKLRCLF